VGPVSSSPSDPTALDPTTAEPDPAPPAARRAPRQLGPYRVVREVGRGGMGAVYEVRHPDLPDRALALKLMLGEPDGVALARFEREGQLLARVRHRGVLMVHHAGRLQEGPYLVTDLVVGSSLAGLARAGAVAPRRAAELVRDLADAVAAMHAAGVLHRDLKPDNVLLREEDGSPVLLDFGIARDLAAQRLTATGTVIGTPSYMAPEQAEGGSPAALDARVDVYGLGGLLFFLLADRAPHAAATPLMSIKRALVDEPAWPSRDRADVPAELEGILRRAMAHQRDDRYPTAAALRDDLARWLAGQRPAAPAPPRRRGALVAGVAGLAVVAALAGAALARGAGAPTAPLAPATEPPATEPPATEPPATEPPATAPARDAPARGSWQARLHAASPPPWSKGPHLVLQAAKGGPVKAVFLDDDHVVTVAGSTLAVWTLEGQRDPQTEPASTVDLPLGDEPLQRGLHEGWRHLARRPGGLLVAATLTRGLCEVTLDGAQASVRRRPLVLSGGGGLSGALATLGEDALVARLTSRRVGRLTSQVLRVDPAGRARPLFDVPGSVQALAARGDLVAAASRLSGQDSGGVVVWNVAEGRQVLRFDQAASACQAVAFDPSGTWLAVGQEAGLLEHVDLATHAQRELVTTSELARFSRVTAVAFDPAGRLWSAGGSRDSGQLVGWAHDRPIAGLARVDLPALVSVDAAPSGRAVVAGTATGEAHVWLVPPP
jgi:hypothetical protein